MNYKDVVQPEFHDIAGSTFKFVKDGDQWSASRAHAFMSMSKAYTHESKEALIRIIEAEKV